MADPVIEPVTVSEVTSGDYEGTIFVGSTADDVAGGKLITGSGEDLDVMFVLVSGYLVRISSLHHLFRHSKHYLHCTEAPIRAERAFRCGTEKMSFSTCLVALSSCPEALYHTLIPHATYMLLFHHDDDGLRFTFEIICATEPSGNFRFEPFKSEVLLGSTVLTA